MHCCFCIFWIHYGTIPEENSKMIVMTITIITIKLYDVKQRVKTMTRWSVHYVICNFDSSHHFLGFVFFMCPVLCIALWLSILRLEVSSSTPSSNKTTPWLGMMIGSAWTGSATIGSASRTNGSSAGIGIGCLLNYNVDSSGDSSLSFIVMFSAIAFSESSTGIFSTMVLSETIVFTYCYTSTNKSSYSILAYL